MISPPHAEKNYNLSNGDVVVISWKSLYSEYLLGDMDSILSEATGLKLKKEDFEYKVKNLK